MTNTLQTTSTIRNPFLTYAEAMAPRRLDGEMLKFVKGDYLVGKDGAVMPHETQLVAIMSTLAIGWIKWLDGKPAEYRMGYVIDGFTPPRRSDLDDNESDNWERDSAGETRDPWQFTNTLVFIAPAQRIYTFSTTSRGGFVALAELCKAHAKAAAGTYPRVSLNIGSYQHKEKSIGKVKFPILEVVGRVGAAPYDEALARSRGEAQSPPTAAELPASEPHGGYDLDDAIPF